MGADFGSTGFSLCGFVVRGAFDFDLRRTIDDGPTPEILPR